MYVNHNYLILMPSNMTRDKIKKLKDSQSSEGGEITTTEKNETTTKAVTYDVIKAGSTSSGIIDILESPDVAVWSKGIMKKTNTPADKVQEPSRVKSTATHIEHDQWEEKQSNLQQTVDPANKEDVAKAIGAGASLTDEERSFVQRSKKAAAPSEE
jgi:hypothetical protein